MNTDFLTEVLDAIEMRESRLLVWGLVDGRLTEEDLGDLINPLLDVALDKERTDLFDVNQVLGELKSRGLLFETDSFPYPGYRSRMAETIRLLFRLRQLFPKHSGQDGWQQARTLVADYRFSWRRRIYPNRNLSIADAHTGFSEKVKNPISKGSLDELLSNRHKEFNLSGFQVRAANRILENLEAKRTSGTLISAGTGSGKTLAFYLPAMSRISTILVSESRKSNWVKILAIYPRTELLRDQFADIYTEARRLDKFIVSRGGRKVRIGALFGETPKDARSLERYGHKGWRKIGAGYVCGFMVCAAPKCGEDLVWLHEELQKEKESLTCVSCGQVITDDELVLTRASLEKSPPDILFTTTEMLNQRLSDSDSAHLFGVRNRNRKPPEMVLLDEVHTYAGSHGAQVGYLLRRWRHLVRSPVSFIGLSATLRDGERFFSSLTGLKEQNVVEICPEDSEMSSEGAEYILALRGDPVSRASLLATTIQASMLISRMLDVKKGKPSMGLYGNRVFTFTDDIDVNNRLYFSLLDAEGRTDKGAPNFKKHPDGGLAVLRRSMMSDSQTQFGQDWSVPELLGHSLIERKLIGRTSSQDTGVSANMDVIVATASLEVGFNDSQVGAVIQHKSPRDPAQFLQRKGRAGRPRNMRPWTVVVLSDYGRDRLAYRNYEQLFDPEIKVRFLPLSSRYIQRMQSVYALIDYLGVKMSYTGLNGNVWKDLCGPVRSSWRIESQRRLKLINILTDLLEKSDFADEFQEYLESALGLSSSDVLALLWEFPRPVLTTAIPTALRRLSTTWQKGSENKADFKISNLPLPEFIPKALFSDLNLPEVQIVIPSPWEGDDPKIESMPVVQALKTFAPGRVSRRFGIERSYIKHWVSEEIPGEGVQNINIDDYFESYELGTWEVDDSNKVNTVPVYRPVQIIPRHPSSNVADTSNAYLKWHTQLVALRHGAELIAPTSSCWRELLKIESYSHFEHTPVEVRRFTTGSIADIKYTNGEGHRTDFNFKQNDDDVALGFYLTVDALRFNLKCPEEIWANLTTSEESIRAVRTKRFFDAVWEGESLVGVDNPFARQWLGLIYFTAISHEALTRKVNLSDAADAFTNGTACIEMNAVLETLFQSPSITQEMEEGDSSSNSEGQDRLRQELDGLLGRKDIMLSLKAIAVLLWQPIDTSWEAWLVSRFTVTVAAAAHEAIQNLCPEIETDGLVVDVDTGPKAKGDVSISDANCTSFWISETSPGGSGLIETFHKTYAEDPLRFYSLLTTALAPTEYEIIDSQLGELLTELNDPTKNSDLIGSVHSFRTSQKNSEIEVSFKKLRQQLSSKKFALFHSFMSAMSNRILRAGASIDTDKFLYNAWCLWVSEEKRLGVELDARSIAYTLSQDDEVDKLIALFGGNIPQENLLTWRISVITGLLWGRGGDARRVGLQLYNPFTNLPDAERLLVFRYLDNLDNSVLIGETEWQKRALERLGTTGKVTLKSALKGSFEISDALRFFITNPVESDYLSVYARVVSARMSGEFMEIDLTIEEISQ